jgi:hypothetical protein
LFVRGACRERRERGKDERERERTRSAAYSDDDVPVAVAVEIEVARDIETDAITVIRIDPLACAVDTIALLAGHLGEHDGGVVGLAGAVHHERLAGVVAGVAGAQHQICVPVAIHVTGSRESGGVEGGGVVVLVVDVDPRGDARGLVDRAHRRGVQPVLIRVHQRREADLVSCQRVPHRVAELVQVDGAGQRGGPVDHEEGEVRLVRADLAGHENVLQAIAIQIACSSYW